jgi:hypothetical protein
MAASVFGPLLAQRRYNERSKRHTALDVRVSDIY